MKGDKVSQAGGKHFQDMADMPLVVVVVVFVVVVVSTFILVMGK